MRIIGKQKDEIIFPLKKTCYKCKTVLEVDEDDIKIGYAGLAYFTCPVCNAEVDCEEDALDVDITAENFIFPNHFYHYENGETISDREIKEYVQQGIKYFRDNPDCFSWNTACGDTFVAVYNFCGDQDYHVVVAKNYWDLEIPFSAIDREIVTEDKWINKGVSIKD